MLPHSTTGPNWVSPQLVHSDVEAASTACASVFTTTGGQQDVGIHPLSTYIRDPLANVVDTEQRGGPVSGNDVTELDPTAPEKGWISPTRLLANIYKARAEDGDSLEVNGNRDRLTNDASKGSQDHLGTPGHICASAPGPRSRRHNIRRNGKSAVHHSAPKRKRSSGALDAQACHDALKSSSKRRRLKPKRRAFAGKQIDMLPSPCIPPAELRIKKPHRVKKRGGPVWACVVNGCSRTSTDKALSMRHILTHFGVESVSFGCNRNFGTELDSLKQHVKKAQRFDKMSPCVKRGPLAQKRDRKSGKADWKRTTWDKDQFLGNPTLNEQVLRFDGGDRPVRVKWV